MTNEEKAREIAGLCPGCFDERKSLTCQFDCANKGKYYGALEMAEWKDQQFRVYLEKRKEQESHITGCASYQYGRRRIIDEIINDLFPKTEEQDNSDRDE